MGPSRASSLFLPFVIVMAVVFILVNGYRAIVNDDDEDDDDSITITFNCTQVLGNQNNYPEFVVQQCKQLRANE